jgi:tRNA A-37 threonylcarbamoyl transferase component Bud32
MERIEGDTLRQIGQLSESQLQGLVDLQALQSAMGIYIGDLNGQNLIWSKGSWWIVDCGSVRQGRSPKYIKEKLALRWSKWFPEA